MKKNNGNNGRITINFPDPDPGLIKRINGLGDNIKNLFLIIYFNFIVLLFFFISFFILLVFVSPLLITSSNDAFYGAGIVLYNLVGHTQICHQLPYRSFFINGIQQAVCARDIGIFIGFVSGAIIVFLNKYPKKFSSFFFPIICMVPLALDGITQSIMGVRESNNTFRIITGIIFGFGLTGYSFYKIIKRYHNFRKYALNPYSIFTTLTISTILYAFIILGSSGIGEKYYSIDQLNDKLAESADGDIHIYYIPPKTHISLNHINSSDFAINDPIISDILSSNWSKEESGQYAQKILTNSSALNHGYGVWAIFNGTFSKSKNPFTFMPTSSGDYYYVDSKTGEVFMQFHRK